MKVNRNKEQIIDPFLSEYLSYNPDTGQIIRIKKTEYSYVKEGKEATTKSKDGYLTVWLKGISFLAHRVAWRLHYGKWPEYQIDHINGNRSDNRICNLRDATPLINSLNKEKHRNGGLHGCYFFKRDGTYRAQIEIKTIVHLGYFPTELEAHQQHLRAREAIKKRKFKSAKELRDYLASTKK